MFRTYLIPLFRKIRFTFASAFSSSTSQPQQPISYPNPDVQTSRNTATLFEPFNTTNDKTIACRCHLKVEVKGLCLSISDNCDGHLPFQLTVSALVLYSTSPLPERFRQFMASTTSLRRLMQQRGYWSRYLGSAFREYMLVMKRVMGNGH